ncbi:MAG TPA: serine/threonine-protein kinase [Anaerolineae bacterium]|nr:serine/threonine-protein kinase [Anaerolineae bacterium]HQI83066.1 serine/threonine-protein kinase [Anaerolineae bacterium]
MLREGTILQQNRYRITHLLGRGGMGAVYAAWHLSLEIPVAIKELMVQADLDPEMLAQLRAQFKREAVTLARLNHNNLVRVMDSFEEGSNAYLVMEMVEGESLADRIGREGALPQALVLRWAHQLLDALAYCHGQNVLHRDIKPTNIIIRPDGQAVLVDFGLVKLWDPRDPRTMTVVRGMGTPEYAPPEQYEAESGFTDVRSDIYGLGATLYHALVGQAPPTATKRIVNPAALLPVRALIPNVDPAIEAALMRALELRPIDRFQSAREMASALSAGAPRQPAQPPVAGPPRPPAMPPRTQAVARPVTGAPQSPPPAPMPQRARPLPMPKVQRDGKAAASIAAFVLGVLGLVTMVLLPLCNLPLPLIGIVVSILGIRSKQRRGLAWAGLALCLLTLALTLILLAIGALSSLSEYGSF